MGAGKDEVQRMPSGNKPEPVAAEMRFMQDSEAREQEERWYASCLADRPHEDLCMMVAKHEFLLRDILRCQSTVLMYMHDKNKTDEVQDVRMAGLTQLINALNVHVEGLYAKEAGVVQ